jgi:hypothetical protein
VDDAGAGRPAMRVRAVREGFRPGSGMASDPARTTSARRHSEMFGKSPPAAGGGAKARRDAARASGVHRPRGNPSALHQPLPWKIAASQRSGERRGSGAPGPGGPRRSRPFGTAAAAGIVGRSVGTGHHRRERGSSSAIGARPRPGRGPRWPRVRRLLASPHSPPPATGKRGSGVNQISRWRRSVVIAMAGVLLLAMAAPGVANAAQSVSKVRISGAECEAAMAASGEPARKACFVVVETGGGSHGGGTQGGAIAAAGCYVPPGWPPLWIDLGQEPVDPARSGRSPRLPPTFATRRPARSPGSPSRAPRARSGTR